MKTIRSAAAVLAAACIVAVPTTANAGEVRAQCGVVKAVTKVPDNAPIYGPDIWDWESMGR